MVFIEVKYGYLCGSDYTDAVAEAIAEADGMCYHLFFYFQASGAFLTYNSHSMPLHKFTERSRLSRLRDPL